MIKKLPLIISIAGALSLSCFTIYQSDVIADLRNDLSRTLQKLAKTETALASEMERSEALKAEIEVLNDSVSMMSITIEDLNGKIKHLTKTVSELNEIIRKKDDKVLALTKEINRLEKKNGNYELRISELEKEREKILIDMQELDRLRTAARTEKIEKEQKQSATAGQKQNAETAIRQKQEEQNRIIIPADGPKINQAPGSPGNAAISDELTGQIKTSQQKKLAGIISNTKVNFEKVSLRNRENSRELKKIKENTWHYTFIDFSMENPEQGALAGEQFLLQIYDVDQNKVVPLNEHNPAFPESGQGAIGYIFEYTGKPMSVRYFNSQKKEGSNYLVRLYYYKDNLVIPLRNGETMLVQNGDVVAK